MAQLCLGLRIIAEATDREENLYVVSNPIHPKQKRDAVSQSVVLREDYTKTIRSPMDHLLHISLELLRFTLQHTSLYSPPVVHSSFSKECH